MLALFAMADLVLLFTGITIHSEPLAARPRIWTTALAHVGGGSDYGYLTFLALLPLAVGAFAGAPVIVSELESGTARFAWTQGYERVRLVAAKLAIIAAILAGGAASLGLTFQWWFAPFSRLRFGEPAFSIYPPTLIGWTLGAFALAVLLGLVCRGVRAAAAAAMLLALAADYALNRQTLVGAPAGVPPAGGFWSFQFIEAGVVLAAAVVFAAVAMLFVRRPRIARPPVAGAVAGALPAEYVRADRVPAVSAAPASAAPARLAPITGRRRLAMAWITWRQHRLGLSVMAAFAAVIAFYQVKYWIRVSGAYHAISAHGCHVKSLPCFANWVRLTSYPRVELTLALLGLVGLIAMEFGPTVGREFEWGTDRLLWTQGVGRVGWTAGRLATLTAFILAIALPVALLAPLSIAPVERIGFASRWTFSVFLTGAPLYLSLIACVLALAMLAGVVIKRTLGAMGVIFGGLVLGGLVLGVRLADLYGRLLSIGIRVGPGSPVDPQQLVAGLSRPYPNPAGVGPPGSWVTRGWYVGRKGATLSQAAAAKVTEHLPAGTAFRPQLTAAWLARQHLRYLVAYQPADRFWLFQCIAAACLLAVAAMAWAATLWVVRSSSR